MHTVTQLCLRAPELQESSRDHGACRQTNRKVRFGMQKVALLLALLHHHSSVLLLDLDVAVFKDPMPLALDAVCSTEDGQAVPCDIVVSTGFRSDCINIGVWYVRASAQTVRWTRALLSRLYWAPYLQDQTAVEEFLMQRRSIYITWTTFDATRQVVLARTLDHTGFVGNGSDIHTFHLLDGGSAATAGDSETLDQSRLAIYSEARFPPLSEVFFNVTAPSSDLISRAIALSRRPESDLRDVPFRSCAELRHTGGASALVGAPGARRTSSEI